MRIIYNVRHRYAIRLKFGGKVLIFLNNLVLEVKTSIRSVIEENLLSCFPTFSAFVIVAIIQHISIMSASQRNASCNRNH